MTGTETRRPARGGVVLLVVVLPLLGGLVGFMGGVVTAYVSPRKYESKAVVQVVPSPVGTEIFGGLAGGSREGSTSQGFATECAVITSQATIERVAGKLDLTSRWNLPPDQVADMLKAMVAVEQLRNTDLIEIRVRHINAEDARDIADMVAREYTARRTGMEMERAHDALEILDAELKEQKEKVAQKRKVLETLMQTPGGSSSMTGGEVDEFGRSRDEINGAVRRQRDELENLKEQLDAQIKSLRTFRGENLFRYAAGLNLPQNGATVLYHEYRADLRKMNSLADAGMGDAHPEMVGQSARVDMAEKELEREVISIRKIMETQLELVENRLERMEQVVTERREGGFDQSIDDAGYAGAKRDYEEDLAMLQHQKLAQSSQRIALKIPRTPITILEEARLGRAPVSPNVPLILAGGAVGGAVLGLLLAAIIALAGMVKRRGA